MKPLRILALSAVMTAVLILPPTQADAQQQHMVGGVPRNNFTGHSNNFSRERGHGFKGGFGGVWVVEREVEVPVYVEVPAPTPPPVTSPLPPHQGEGDKRKPYVIGASYDSLPGGCMKLIEEGVSFYYCSGEWYQEVRAGRNPLYRAVARKL